MFYIPLDALKPNKSQNIKLEPLTFLKNARAAFRHKMQRLQNIFLVFYLHFAPEKINSARKTALFEAETEPVTCR